MRAEIGRIDARKAAQLASWLPTRTESVTFELSTAHAYRGDGRPPRGGPGGRAQEVWDALGLAVQIGPPDTSVEVGPVELETVTSDRDDEEPLVRWRVPRRVQVTIWRRADSGPVLESSDQQWVVDEHCDTRTLPLRERLFGSSSANITFGPLGAPSLVTTGSTSAAGALGDALGGVPADVAAGLASATSLTSGVTGLLDAGAERQLAGVKRRVELQQKRLELLGSAATEDDYVKLKVLQQRVEIADAEGKLLPPDELAVLKGEVELLKQRRELEKLLHPDT
ncbi:hypothetical protein [uncultured Friedmanniella sp.]|uniref:hypothetical protein n=1 Tax=uncultured Friedmanniella sp. TaxID=335381 RepID=UPI0035CAA730